MPIWIFLVLNVVTLAALGGVIWAQIRAYKAAKELARLERRSVENSEALIMILRQLDGARIRFEKDDGTEGVINFGSDGPLH